MTTAHHVPHIGITRAIEYLAENYAGQPSLGDAASEAGLSPHHFQRLFTRDVGISPKKFVQHLTLRHAKESLTDSASVLDATLDAGLSGPGRLHDLFVAHEAMTPGEWKRHGAGLQLTYGWHPSPFGSCLIVAGDRGVCGMAFAPEPGCQETLEDLASSLDGADWSEDAAATEAYAEQAFGDAGGTLRVVLRGTSFQIKVWEALLRIPAGRVVDYGGLASALGQPSAARAVAGAVARNPVSWLVPCHRVIRSTGAITGYRWGPTRKRAMLAVEAAGWGRRVPGRTRLEERV